MWLHLFCISVCLATTGVCVFVRWLRSAHFFIFMIKQYTASTAPVSRGHFMSATLNTLLSFLLIGIIFALVYGVLNCLFRLWSFILDHITPIFLILQNFLFGVILIIIIKNALLINAFFSQNSLNISIFIITNILIFLTLPRKGVICTFKHRECSKNHKSDYSTRLSSKNFKDAQKNSCQIYFDEFLLYGAVNPITNISSKANPCKSKVVGQHKILIYKNWLNKYIITTLPDHPLTKIFLFCGLFSSTIWLLIIGIVGIKSPAVTQILLFSSLWFIFYNKKIYFSLAHVKAHGANKITFVISVLTDILICALNIFALGGMQSLYLEAFVIYALFISLSTLWFIVKHKNQ